LISFIDILITYIRYNLSSLFSTAVFGSISSNTFIAGIS